MTSERQGGTATGPPLSTDTAEAEAAAAVGRRKRRAACFSVASNTCLTAFKLLAWLVTGSVSVLSEALHSGLDLCAAGMALLAVRKSSEPADAEHQFGHGKFESLAGLVEGGLIMAAVGVISWNAVERLATHQAEVREPAVGVAVMGISAVVNTLVSRMLFRVARQTDSVALEADAWHLRTDVWTSAGVFGGLAVILAASRLGFREAHMLDPVVALGVALVIARAAWDIMRRSWGHLVDRSLPAAEIAVIEALLRDHYPELSDYHQLRTRKSGPQRYIDLHVLVPGEESVSDAHALCDHLESDLRSLLPEVEVMIHIEPAARERRGQEREGVVPKGREDERKKR